MLLSLIYLMACGQENNGKDSNTGSGPEENDADTDADSDSDSDADSDACTLTIASIEPGNGSTDVALTAWVTAQLSGPVSDEPFSLTLDPPAPGSLQWSDDGLSATLVPDEPLLPSTAYTATASVCDAPVTSTFTTQDPPPELDLVGNAYVVDLNGADVTWVEPAGFGSLFMSFLVIDGLLIEVESHDASTLDTIASAAVATQSGFSQFVCIEPIDFVPASFASSPNFAVGPKDTMLSTSGYNVDTYALTVEGQFSADGQGIDDMTISGLVDSRDISPGVGFDVCDLVPCGACPDGANACITLIIEDTYAPLDENIDIDPTVNPADYPDCRNL